MSTRSPLFQYDPHQFSIRKCVEAAQKSNMRKVKNKTDSITNLAFITRIMSSKYRRNSQKIKNQ